jgi:hypothetical protein
MSSHVAVAIVGFRNPDDIVRCLSALEHSTHRDFEVIVCENGGPEAHATLCAMLKPKLAGGQVVRILLANGNPGFAGGVNVCLAASRDADAWWILNPDTEAGPGAMAALLDRLARGDCDAVGGVLAWPGGVVQSLGGTWQKLSARAVSIGHGQPANQTFDPALVEPNLSYLSGASMMVGRAFLEAVGPLREDYFLYCEEVEWFLRGAARGMRLGFAPLARVTHHHGTTTGMGKGARSRPRTPVYLDERNRLLVTRDCFSTVFPIAVWGALFALVLRFGRRRAWRQLGYGLQGWWAGLSDQRGAPSWLEG